MVHKLWQDYPDIEQALVETKVVMRSGIRLRIPDIEAKIYEYIDAPGKYLRSGLALLFYQLGKGEIQQEAILYGASLELFHLATLIHDDVIDDAQSRRGIETIQVKKGNKIAIYAGDYLLSYSSRLITQLKGQEAIQNENSWLLEQVMQGELRQLTNSFNQDMSMVEYLRQIRGKTAMLFAMATSGGYYLGANQLRKARLAKILGIHLGMAFQLQDDLIDYTVEMADSGKPRMQDVQNGIYTAPLLIAMEINPRIHSLISETNVWNDQTLEELYTLMKETGAFAQTEKLIESYMSKALKMLNSLGESSETINIKKVIEILANRRY